MMTLVTSSLEDGCICISPWQSVLDVSYCNIHKQITLQAVTFKRETSLAVPYLPSFHDLGIKIQGGVIPSCYGSNICSER